MGSSIPVTLCLVAVVPVSVACSAACCWLSRALRDQDPSARLSAELRSAVIYNRKGTARFFCLQFSESIFV